MNAARRLNDTLARGWRQVGPRFLPFADAATTELPLGRLLRLSLFQVSVGMALALPNGTLNRVMIVELGVAAWLVSAMVALPILFAPLRALIGFRSDTHRSYWGWKRVPSIYVGSFMQFGGLAIMPFALLLLSGEQAWGGRWIAYAGSAQPAVTETAPAEQPAVTETAPAEQPDVTETAPSEQPAVTETAPAEQPPATAWLEAVIRGARSSGLSPGWIAGLERLRR